MRFFGDYWQNFGELIGRSAAAGGAGVLPIDIDFTALADGALPSPLTGATWVVSGGKAINTPTHGATLIADGDMEAAGVTNWAAVGTPTVREKSNTQVFAGSQSLHIAADANNEGVSQNFTAENGKWYRFLAQTYAAAGAANLQHTLGGTIQGAGNATAAWAQIPMTCFHATTTGSQTIRLVCGSGADAYYDDAAIQEVDFASMLAVLPPTQADIVLRAPLTQADLHTQIGFILNLDSLENPQNFVLVFIWWYSGSTSMRIGVLKCVNGIVSQVALPQPGNYAAGRELEVRKAGTSYAVYYHNTLIDTYTISDASIVDNTIHGFFSPHGGNSLNRFFAVSQLEEVKLAFGGSSITASTLTLNYRRRVMDWIHDEKPKYDAVYVHAARGGCNMWNNLVRLAREVLSGASPDIVIFDHGNNQDRALDYKATEAYIRRLRTANPNVKIAIMNYPTVTSNADNNSIATPTNQTIAENLIALAEYYEVAVIDQTAALQELVLNQGHSLSTYLGDTVHPTEAGYEVAFEISKPYLETFLTMAQQVSGELPAAIYDADGDLQQEPTILDGADYDSRSGTWSDDGTAVVSSEAGATITFTATCSSWGFDRTDTTAVGCQASVDGGAFVGVNAPQNGTEIAGGRGEHTITIKVLTNVRIDEFWAI